MNLTQSTESRRQQAHRRLSELDLAVRLGGEPEMAWHMTQARRSGASLPEILDAIKLGMKMRGTPAAALTRCAHELIRRVFDAHHALGSSRQPRVVLLSGR